jgi:glucokinase
MQRAVARATAGGSAVLKVGIDIGGTKIAGGVVDSDGRIVEKLRVDTPTDTSELAGAVIDMARHLSVHHDVSAVGVAAAGFIDRDRATVIHAPNIAWRNEPLKAVLEAGIDVPVTIENDANAAGWAEFRFGAGRGVGSMVMLTMGTGVGGAVVIDGELFRGGHGIGAELGHMRFIRDGLPCGCGQNGCLEQYASGRALQREANAIADAGGIGAGLAAVRAEKGTLAGPAISRLVLAGDEGAVEALRRVATALGEACGGFQAVLDPELFVIGGGVAQLGDDLLEPVRIAYETSLPGYGDRPVADFAIAELGNDAGLIGAADLATTDAVPARIATAGAALGE